MRTLLFAILLFTIAYSITKFVDKKPDVPKKIEIPLDDIEVEIPDLHDVKIEKPRFPKMKSTTLSVVDFTSSYSQFDINKTNLIIAYLISKDSVFSFTELDADLHEHLMYMIDENLLVSNDGVIVATDKLQSIYNDFVENVVSVRLDHEIFTSVGYTGKNDVEFGYCKIPFEQYIDLRIPIVKNYTNIPIDDYVFSVLLIEGFFDPVIDDYFISKVNRGLVRHNINKVKQKAFHDASNINIKVAFEKGLVIQEKIFY